MIDMTGQIQSPELDVLIVGGGLAALRAAIAAAESYGTRVGVAVKRKLGRSGSSANTSAGYAVVFPEEGVEDHLEAHLRGKERRTEDSTDVHFQDTMAGGGGVNDPQLVRIMCEEAPDRLQELLDWGVEMDIREGKLHKSPGGDHTFARTVGTKSHLGLDITSVLVRVALDLGVEAYENCMVLEPLVSEGRIAGAVCLDRAKGELLLLRAKTVILAAGGCGRLFSWTSNPVDVTGDGFILAYRAGASLRDMEFIQYYPWRCIKPFGQTRMPIQPSTFSVGGKLFNSDGERFMEKYDPERKDATFRDVAARGIYDQIRFGKSIEGGVLLDISEVSPEDFEKTNVRLSRVYAQRSQKAHEMQMIIAPEAHYFMGGVLIDENGKSNVPGLFAAGENAGGIQGGNRLNSNSLPDTQVFGKRAGETAAADSRELALAPLSEISSSRWKQKFEAIKGEDNPEVTLALKRMRKDLAEKMWLHLGIIRNANSLSEGLDYLHRAKKQIGELPLGTAKHFEAAVELGCLIETGIICSTAAITRTESRAAHYREDFPETDDENWKKAVIVQLGKDGNPEVSFSSCAVVEA